MARTSCGLRRISAETGAARRRCPRRTALWRLPCVFMYLEPPCSIPVTASKMFVSMDETTPDGYEALAVLPMNDAFHPNFHERQIASAADSPQGAPELISPCSSLRGFGCVTSETATVTTASAAKAMPAPQKLSDDRSGRPRFGSTQGGATPRGGRARQRAEEERSVAAATQVQLDRAEHERERPTARRCPPTDSAADRNWRALRAPGRSGHRRGVLSRKASVSAARLADRTTIERAERWRHETIARLAGHAL
jgi:hypothetical protein